MPIQKRICLSHKRRASFDIPLLLLSLVDSLNALQADTPHVVSVSNNQVRYILNALTAQSVFGTPLGAPRNLSQDAPFNVFNAALFKNIKLSEHSSFEFRATALNAFNHASFRSIDPVLEDAGVTPAPFTGFGDPSVTDDAPGGALGNRVIKVGLTFRF